MQLTVKKWGNSASIRIPAAIMEAAHLKLDDPVDVREEDGRIIIEPLAHKAYDLDALLAEITPDNLHAEVGTGPAVGNEAW
ncbi:MAG: AbrB/MazE/SpoVT family DNA-binding domain-containing protein [Proteobacteria bacterium]|nr:AbrB/MazE/SpoVT family DNA-binding domain-containing protein [Pseudomonadota bacterium]MBS0551805.1 AbrB/MazE/SpoVT family DNA-binding domain-containing protein [Pseudomonadota bacterium]